MAKTTIYGGPGIPLTLQTFVDSTFGIHVHGDSLGDGRTSADFSYRIPKMRDWLTFYGEAMSEDEPSPIPYMRQSIFQGGLYFAKIPRIPKIDLRLEGGSTSAVDYYDRAPISTAMFNTSTGTRTTVDSSVLGWDAPRKVRPCGRTIGCRQRARSDWNFGTGKWIRSSFRKAEPRTTSQSMRTSSRAQGFGFPATCSTSVGRFHCWRQTVNPMSLRPSSSASGPSHTTHKQIWAEH